MKVTSIFLFLFLAGSVSAQNPDLPFTSGSTGEDGPLFIPAATSSASGFGLAYDEERQEVVRFSSGQTWVFRETGWIQLAPANSPSNRSEPAMAYDAKRKEVILFGGFVTGVGRQSDTWRWNGSNWSQASPVTSPPARTSASMCWDPIREEIVLFGGQTANASGGVRGAAQDTWVWDGITWTQKTPVAAPLARTHAVMAFYPPAGAVALATGHGNSSLTAQYYGDLWLWDGTNWISEGNPFQARTRASLVYDPLNAELLLYGGNYTYVGGGSVNYSVVLNELVSWNKTRPVPLQQRLASPVFRYAHQAVWHLAKQRMLVTSGVTQSPPATSSGSFTTIGLNDTWWWDGKDWLGAAAPIYTFELNKDEQAIWHFTTITIPFGNTVNFKRNTANTPVVWLASESVNIDGTLDVSGQSGAGTGQTGSPAVGGPGGYDGGEGSSVSLAAQAGGGPAGGTAGAVGSTAGGNAGPTSNYVSPFGLPLFGGSGGGGAHVAGGNGSKAGGGGGALFIASSKDIAVTGTIKATGGVGNAAAPAGGHGGGGTIKLMADRVLAATGTLNTAGGGGAANQGLVRIEAFVRQLSSGNITGSLFQSVPTDVPPLAQAGGRLFIKTVDGQAIAPHPTGNAINPDVVFSNPDPVPVVVEALNIPNGTAVTLEIKHSNGTIYNYPASGTVNLASGQATFTVDVPPGSGTVQAFASYTIGQPPVTP